MRSTGYHCSKLMSVREEAAWAMRAICPIARTLIPEQVHIFRCVVSETRLLLVSCESSVEPRPEASDVADGIFLVFLKRTVNEDLMADM